MIDKASVAPPEDGTSSVIFALGTPITSVTARAARRWVDAMVAAAPTGCRAFELGRNNSFERALGEAVGAVHGATLANDVLDTRFGGLRGHTLVIVAEPAPGGGFLSFAGAKTVAIANDVTHLDAMKKHDVIYTHHPDAEVRSLEHVLNALWLGKFRTVCLVPTAAGPALDTFAEKLAALSGCVVHYNHQPVQFTVTGSDVVARVMASGAPVKGRAFVKDQQVDLVSAANCFLPGAEARK